MKSLRITLTAVVLAVSFCYISSANTSQESTKPAQANATGVKDFDFLVGEWRVHHRRLQADRNGWVEFDGTCSNHKLMDGSANIEEHALNCAPMI